MTRGPAVDRRTHSLLRHLRGDRKRLYGGDEGCDIEFLSPPTVLPADALSQRSTWLNHDE